MSTAHGVIFRTRDTFDHPADTDWTKEHNELYAPDVVEKDGKYYLFAYIIGAKGCVAVSDRPEGPFTLLGRYKYTIPDSVCVNGWFIDPGVLVDDDGQVYIACGFERSFIAKIDAQDMTHVLDDTYLEHIIPCEVTENGGFTDPDSRFYEAASLRKIGNTYYFIYSPKRGSRLAYATSDKPMGPYTYRGYGRQQPRVYLPHWRPVVHLLSPHDERFGDEPPRVRGKNRDSAGRHDSAGGDDVAGLFGRAESI